MAARLGVPRHFTGGLLLLLRFIRGGACRSDKSVCGAAVSRLRFFDVTTITSVTRFLLPRIPSKPYSTSSRLIMGSISEPAVSPVVDSAPLAPFRVLVVGGSYGGLSAALNLQDLCSGRTPRCGEPPEEDDPAAESFQVAVDITVVDERDGFCRLLSAFLISHVVVSSKAPSF